MGEPAQAVDCVGLFSVMCYVLSLKHDALAQQLCGFVSCSSQGIDQMQCECHGSWHSQKSDVCLTISRTTQRVRGALPPVPVLVEDGPMCVYVLNEVRGCCVAGLCMHHACVHACLNC